MQKKEIKISYDLMKFISEKLKELPKSLGKESLSTETLTELLLAAGATEDNIEEWLFRARLTFNGWLMIDPLSTKYKKTADSGFYYFMLSDHPIEGRVLVEKRDGTQFKMNIEDWETLEPSSREEFESTETIQIEGKHLYLRVTNNRWDIYTEERINNLSERINQDPEKFMKILRKYATYSDEKEKPALLPILFNVHQDYGKYLVIANMLKNWEIPTIISENQSLLKDYHHLGL